MRFLIQISKQINTIFLKRADGSQTKRKEVCEDRSSIYRLDFRSYDNKNDR